MGGKLIGIGVGPGDPELITLKGLKALQSADVVAFHASPAGRSTARSIVEEYLQDHQVLELLEYPVTTGTTSHPGGYAGAMAEFYVEATQRLRSHLIDGKTVAVLALGDPMLYSSYQHLHRELADEFPAEIIPGISSVTAAADVLGKPLAEEEEIFSIIPATVEESTLIEALSRCDTAVIMKLGRNFDKVRSALMHVGKAERAYVCIRVGMDGEQTMKLLDADPDAIPYFAVAVVPSLKAESAANQTPDAACEHQHAPSGQVTVVGLGPGKPEWTTPEVSRALREATDIVGYSTYVNRVPEFPGQRRHLSDNKVEAERAAMALDMAKRGRNVVVVSSGDPGVFAMAAAVIETADDDQWREVPVRVLPGMTAAQAVASRVGAPLGHDFGMISLSDRLKPFEAVERRVRALAGADMAFAVYNPASKERRWQIARLKEIVLEYQDPSTPVIIARAVGSQAEAVTLTTLAEFDPDIVDMRTMVIVGASNTRTYETKTQGRRVFTARTYRS